jgi:hypothetical protein
MAMDSVMYGYMFEAVLLSNAKNPCILPVASTML